MSGRLSGIGCARGADVLVRDHFCVRPGESVVVSADPASDMAVAEAIVCASAALGAKPVLLMIRRLPFQGTLADPFVPEALEAAVGGCDVWFDLTFPYLAGSGVHGRTMHAGRARYLLVGDLTAEGFERLYGMISLDQLFEVQQGFDQLVAEHAGAACRVTSPSGTDVTFTLGRTATQKLRRTERPGSFTIMGTAIFFPEPDSVQGRVCLDSVFHEHYTVLRKPMEIAVEGRIREVRDRGPQSLAMARALKRAGKGDLGQIIHFTCGFHPAARFAGASFIEDIRAIGTNAVGMGEPWWLPGGGENHPDAVLTNQSLWIAGEQVVKDGYIVAPSALANQAAMLYGSMG